jgi:hypothetical protein
MSDPDGVFILETGDVKWMRECRWSTVEAGRVPGLVDDNGRTSVTTKGHFRG